MTAIRCIFLVFFVIPWVVTAQQEPPPPTVTTKPAPGIYRIYYLTRVSLVAFTGPDGVMLIDTGYGKGWITEEMWIDTVY